VKFISSVQLQQASAILGAYVFQMHDRARERNSVRKTTRAINLIEETVRTSLADFAKGYPKFEFDWVELQEPGVGVYGDDRA
jgi:hypothetical protein